MWRKNSCQQRTVWQGGLPEILYSTEIVLLLFAVFTFFKVSKDRQVTFILAPPSATMLHSPLKTALAYECFQDQANSTLALPSDHKLKTRGTGKQRVQEQVMMTVKRQKQKSSLSSASNAAGHSNRGKYLLLLSGMLAEV